MNRQVALDALDERKAWDVVVIGGGATGLGCAVDAAARGYRTLLLEQHDFAKGTSSRSTKLIHGGLRYLGQGNWRLVRHALLERRRLLHNAPHLVHRQAFLVPCYSNWQRWYYGAGVKVYDWLARDREFGASRLLGHEAARAEVAELDAGGLRGGALYYDGQFDDARLAISLAQAAAARQATVLNYVRVVRLLQEDNRVRGVVAVDQESGREWTLKARVVINATGIFVDQIRQWEHADKPGVLAFSQGAHLVLDRSFLSGHTAVLIPRTKDGRVLFAIPWLNSVVVGTTDLPVAEPQLEPRPLETEIEFLLDHLGQYFQRPLTRQGLRAVFAGIRPLVRGPGARATSRLARDHMIEVSAGGLVTITGGKWTTYRHMAEETIDRAARVGDLPPRPCTTAELPLPDRDAATVHGWIAAEPGLAERFHPDLPYAWSDILWAIRQEMARTVEDLLARRTRALLLHARAALEAAPAIAERLARELGRDTAWQAEQVRGFRELGARYLVE